MNNVVYKITFTERKKNNNYPYYYIGVKSNCEFINEKIISNNKEYYGSSSHKEYKSAIENEKYIKIEILFSSDSFKTALEKESELQRLYKVVESKEYFNLSIAVSSTYNDPDYITVRHKDHGKICRIHYSDFDKNIWEGVSKGKKWYNDGTVSKTFHPDFVPDDWKLGRLGDFSYSSKNFLKTNTKEELIEKSVKSRKNNNNYVAWNKNKKCGPQSTETKNKRSLTHKELSKKEHYKNAMSNKIWINDGISNKVIDSSSDIPINWKRGMIKKK